MRYFTCFLADGASLRSFHQKRESARRVTLFGRGPEGKTLMGADRETLNAYLGESNP